MKAILAAILCSILFSIPAKAQLKTFSVVHTNWVAPFKAQGSTGCQFFSMVSFLESEIFRLSNRKLELSPMFFMYHVFIEKTEHYLQLRSYDSYSTGGLFDDALHIMKIYGAVPYTEYTGPVNQKGYCELGPLYGEFEYGFLPGLFEKAKNSGLAIRSSNGTMHKPWGNELTSILDRHLGKTPDTIRYNDKWYTPRQFADSIINLPLDQYVKLTSYSSIPFYHSDALFLRDNWLYKNDFYSLPLDQLIETIDSALLRNYTLAIDFDITAEILQDTLIYCNYHEDTVVNQDTRDELLANWLTKDVHLVHLIGLAHDQDGRKYYIIKDSVGKHLGMYPKEFLSENYIRAKVIAVMVHKNGIPASIKARLGL